MIGWTYDLMSDKYITQSYPESEAQLTFLEWGLLLFYQSHLNTVTNITSIMCQVIEYLNIYVPRIMDKLPIWQSCSQPVNPSHVTINGLAHYCTHNASVKQ